MHLQYSHPEHSTIHPKSNLHLDDVTRAIQSNNAIDYSERVRSTLNDRMRNTQAFSLEEKFLEFNNRFRTASETVRARMLEEMDRGMHMLNQEEQNIAKIQDPSEIRGR